MPTWLKIVLGVVAAGMLLVGALVAGGVYWFKAHKGEIAEAGQQAMREGQTYGSGKESPACVDEGFRRLDAASGFSDELKVQLFTRGCLEASARPPGFCEGVPPTSEIMASVRWRAGICSGYPKTDPQKCQRLLQSWQELCERKGDAED